MSGRKTDENFFTRIVGFPGLKLELCSDRIKLFTINFVKENKTVKETKSSPEPVKKILSFLDHYFRGIYLEPEIIFVKKGYEPEPLAGKDVKLILDMNVYTDKEINVYRELLKVKPGTTVSYNELASRSGIPRGARFIGNCMAKNRFPVLIPCHRVIKSDGSTGNFSGGVEVKEFLLKHEFNKFSVVY